MNEEGDIFDADGGAADNPEDQDQAAEDLGVFEHGFEDAHLDVSGFCGDLLNGPKHHNNLRDMFKVS